MEARPLLVPATCATLTLLTALARLDPAVALLAALAGVAALAMYAAVPDRTLLFFALVPVASWIAAQPPWGAIAGAVVIAGTLIITLGDLPTFRMSRRAIVPFAGGAASGFLVGTLLVQTGLMTSVSDGVAVVLVLAVFRTAAVYLGGIHWSYASALGTMTLPQSGPFGLLAAGIETAFGLGMLGTPVRHRLAFVAGAPLALAALF